MNLTKLVLAVGLLCCSNQLLSQSTELVPGYYVVVAAYAKSKEGAAARYVDVLKQKGHNAQYGFNTTRDLYFVYLKYFDNLKQSLLEMKSTRTNGFEQAWVRVVPGDIASKISAPASSQLPVPVTPSGTNVVTPDAVADPVMKEVAPTSMTNEVEVTDNETIVQHQVMTLGNTEVFLSLYNARNNRIVEGQVQVVDTDRSRLITNVKGNEYLVLPDPKSKSGQLTLICEAFGYRKIQQEINYPLPLADTVKPYIDLMGTTLVVNFDLVRYHKGDITTLYNVYFYNDAALMLPTSNYELNSLLQLMNENKNYRIKLHGHTNGNYTGKIMTLGDNKNFFSLDGAKEGMGTAKDLSRNRAEIIRDYLVTNGVETSRVEIKAWGGKRPLYDKNSVNAKKNVRVDVEILSE